MKIGHIVLSHYMKNHTILLLMSLSFLLVSYPAQAQDSLVNEQTTNPWKVKTGGEVRVQYFHYDHREWVKGDSQNFLLTRFLLNGKLTYNNKHSLFVELQSGLANGLKEAPSPVEENILDLHQAYISSTLLKTDNSQLELKLGRQELSYGSQRLISVREGPNNRHSFDAAKIKFNKENFSIDAFAGTYVQAKKGFFNDPFVDDSQTIWSLYAVQKAIPIIHNADLYYIGIHRDKEAFDRNFHKTNKHMLGLRVWKDEGAFQYDFEAVGQMGKAEEGKEIQGSTVSANLSYQWQDALLKPTVGIKAQYISGDRDSTDNKLNTFDPVYPKGAYFGLNSELGPRNLTNYHLYTSIQASKKLSLSLEYMQFWRSSSQDGIYAVSNQVIVPASQIEASSIGSQWQFIPEYQINDKLYIRSDLTYFTAGAFLKEAGRRNYFSASGTIQYKF